MEMTTQEVKEFWAKFRSANNMPKPTVVLPSKHKRYMVKCGFKTSTPKSEKSYWEQYCSFYKVPDVWVESYWHGWLKDNGFPVPDFSDDTKRRMAEMDSELSASKNKPKFRGGSWQEKLGRDYWVEQCRFYGFDDEWIDIQWQDYLKVHTERVRLRNLPKLPICRKKRKPRLSKPKDLIPPKCRKSYWEGRRKLWNLPLMWVEIHWRNWLKGGGYEVPELSEEEKSRILEIDSKRVIPQKKKYKKRYNSFLRSSVYNIFRISVLDRDNHKCVSCGKTPKSPHVHHVKSRKKYPHLALEVSNGITLCPICHWIIHGCPKWWGKH